MHSKQWLPILCSASIVYLGVAGPTIAAETGTTREPVTPAQVQVITDSAIRQTIDSILDAANNRDTEGVAGLLAPNATIEMTVDVSGNPQNFRFNRDQYRAHIQQGFGQVKTYRTGYSNVETQIAADGKRAIATFKMTEEATTQDRILRSVSSQTVQFELIEGQIRVTTIKGIVQFVSAQP